MSNRDVDIMRKTEASKESIRFRTHAEDLKFRLVTIDLLRTAKTLKRLNGKSYTYRELSKKTGLPVTVLSRYVKGHVLPNRERAKKLWGILSKIAGLDVLLNNKIKFDSQGYFDNTSIIGNISLLRQAASYALAKFAGKRITKVLAAAVDGIPLATMISELIGTDLVIAKNSKEVGIHSFLEETYVVDGSGVTMTLYIPKSSIRKRDSVLVVDDVIKKGDTQNALLGLVKKAHADLAGLFIMISIGDEWRKRMKIPKGCQVDTILTVK